MDMLYKRQYILSDFKPIIFSPKSKQTFEYKNYTLHENVNRLPKV